AIEASYHTRGLLKSPRTGLDTRPNPRPRTRLRTRLNIRLNAHPYPGQFGGSTPGSLAALRAGLRTPQSLPGNSELVARTCGPNVWPELVARACGPSLWSKLWPKCRATRSPLRAVLVQHILIYEDGMKAVRRFGRSARRPSVAIGDRPGD